MANQEVKQTPVAFGKAARALFSQDPTCHPLNHGSFGAVPTAISRTRLAFLQESEARIDAFTYFQQPALLQKSREALTQSLLGAGTVDVNEVVFVASASTGVHTVMANVSASWSAAAGDTVLYLSTSYVACRKVLESLAEQGRLQTRAVHFNLLEDDEDTLLDKVRATHAAALAAGQRPRLILVDTVVSMPGVRLPWERLVAMSRDELGLLTLLDGAHAVGLLDLHHLGTPAAQPDFMVSNCHKWLFIPRSSAFLYVPFRNQHLITTSLPTFGSWLPPASRPPEPASAAAGSANYFPSLFSPLNATDWSAFFCIPEAIALRRDVLGGEAAIYDYCVSLARRGGDRVAEILGTEVLDHRAHPEKSRLRDCPMVNIRLPITILPDGSANGADGAIPQSRLSDMWSWCQRIQADEYNTYLQGCLYEDQFWVRISAQIYLDMDDFEWIGHTLLALSARINKGEWKQ